MRALVLCAGEGRRLRPLTQITPKPLVEVAGVPMAVRQILALRRAGIREVVVNAAHGARILMAELGDGSRWGVRIAWSVEGFDTSDALETRGGIVRALPMLTEGGEGAFIVAAGDIASDFDYSELAERARGLSASGDLAHLVTVPNPDFHPAGDFLLRNGRIARRDDPEGGAAVTYASLAAFHPTLFAGLDDRRAKLFPWLLEAAAGRISGSLFAGRWANVGTLVELERAEALFAEDRA